LYYTRIPKKGDESGRRRGYHVSFSLHQIGKAGTREDQLIFGEGRNPPEGGYSEVTLSEITRC